MLCSKLNCQKMCEQRKVNKIKTMKKSIDRAVSEEKENRYVLDMIKAEH